MAEQLVQDEGAGLPICIVRPSIVVSTWKVHFEHKIRWKYQFEGASARVGGQPQRSHRTFSHRWHRRHADCCHPRGGIMHHNLEKKCTPWHL